MGNQVLWDLTPNPATSRLRSHLNANANNELENEAQSGLKELLAKPENRDRPETAEHPAAPEVLEMLDHRVHLAAQDPKDPLATLVLKHQVNQVQLAHQEHLERLDALDPLDPLEVLEKMVNPERLDHLDRLEALANPVEMVALDPKARRETLVHQAPATNAHPHDWLLDIKHHFLSETGWPLFMYSLLS